MQFLEKLYSYVKFKFYKIVILLLTIGLTALHMFNSMASVCWLIRFNLTVFQDTQWNKPRISECVYVCLEEIII